MIQSSKLLSFSSLPGGILGFSVTCVNDLSFIAEAGFNILSLPTQGVLADAYLEKQKSFRILLAQVF